MRQMKIAVKNWKVTQTHTQYSKLRFIDWLLYIVVGRKILPEYYYEATFEYHAEVRWFGHMDVVQTEDEHYWLIDCTDDNGVVRCVSLVRSPVEHSGSAHILKAVSGTILRDYVNKKLTPLNDYVK